MRGTIGREEKKQVQQTGLNWQMIHWCIVDIARRDNVCIMSIFLHSSHYLWQWLVALLLLRLCQTQYCSSFSREFRTSNYPLVFQWRRLDITRRYYFLCAIRKIGTEWVHSMQLLRCWVYDWSWLFFFSSSLQPITHIPNGQRIFKMNVRKIYGQTTRLHIERVRCWKCGRPKSGNPWRALKAELLKCHHKLYSDFTNTYLRKTKSRIENEPH